MMKTVNPLTPGAVIQTHPSRGYWGCAVVLSARDSTDKFLPMSHIGVTSFIARKKFSWKDISPTELEIVRLSYDYRVAPHEYRRSPNMVTCIGIYAIKNAATLRVIGFIDPLMIYSSTLSFDVGDGTSGNYPLCGPIPDDLGREAVIAWRREHDKKRFERETAERRLQHERIVSKLRAADRAARQARQAKQSKIN
jgi:hypothetical protein